MSGLSFIPATLEHARELAGTLRPEDAAEVLACGYSPLEGLERSVRMSSRAWAIVAGGEVAALFGVFGYSGEDAGCIWFLTGQVFLKNWRAVARVAPAVMRELLEGCGCLDNVIDARYSAAVRWARWLGFQVGTAVPYGPEGRLFHPAVITRGV